MINSRKSGDFDNIEFAAAQNLMHSFPPHFHYEYTIGISISGIQRFDLQDATYLVPPASVILINPEQIHAHYPINDSGWSYKSMYISPDFMAYLQKQEGLPENRQLFESPVISNSTLLHNYNWLHSANAMPTEKDFGALIAALYRASLRKDLSAIDTSIPEKISGVRHYLSDHFDHKLQLDDLAAKFHTDKYHLIRQFKKYTGVTPNNFLTMVRIEKARHFIDQDYPIVQAALAAGFYDQSHFHHSFQHYTGYTPGQYQKRSIAELS
jgi:AraC-like DNA-binding protein